MSLPMIERTSRKLDNVPDVRMVHSVYDEAGEVVNRTVKGLVNDTLGTMNNLNQINERESSLVAARYGEEMNNAFNGYMTRDEQGNEVHVKGIREKGYGDYATGDGPLKALEEIDRKFKDRDDYKKLSIAGKKKFDRKVMGIRGDINRRCYNVIAGNKITQIRDENKELDELGDKSVQAVYATSDLTEFVTSRDKQSFEQVLRRFGHSVSNYDALLSDGISNLSDLSSQEIADKLVLTGSEDEQKETRKKFVLMYDAKRKAYNINRISAFTRNAGDGYGLGDLNAEQCIDGARNFAKSLLDQGEINEDEYHTLLNRTIEPANKRLVTLNEQAITAKASESYKAYNLELKKLTYAMMGKPEDMAKIVMDDEAYEAKIEADNTLFPEQKIALKKTYRSLAKNFSATMEAWREYEAKVSQSSDDAVNNLVESLTNKGYFTKDGTFVAAGTFAKESDPIFKDKFDENSVIWSDPHKAMIRLESMRLTGAVSEADYRKAQAKGQMLLKEDATRLWHELLGMVPNLEALSSIGYGNKKAPKKSSNATLSMRTQTAYATGLYAKKSGNDGAGIASFIADALSGDSSEEMVSASNLCKLYENVQRLAAAGVDAKTSLEQILAPSLAEGINRSFEQRLSDPDYMDAVVAFSHQQEGYKTALEKSIQAELTRQQAMKNDATANKEKLTKEITGNK